MKHKSTFEIVKPTEDLENLTAQLKSLYLEFEKTNPKKLKLTVLFV